MKKSWFPVWAACLAGLARCLARPAGIRFEPGGWEKGGEKARQEGKWVCAGFCTEWCGPCLVMAGEVVVREEAGRFCHARFVNVRTESEKGEGRLLRENTE